jgi:hypothetical protein
MGQLDRHSCHVRTTRDTRRAVRTARWPAGGLRPRSLSTLAPHRCDTRPRSCDPARRVAVPRDARRRPSGHEVRSGVRRPILRGQHERDGCSGSLQKQLPQWTTKTAITSRRVSRGGAELRVGVPVSQRFIGGCSQLRTTPRRGASSPRSWKGCSARWAELCHIFGVASRRKSSRPSVAPSPAARGRKPRTTMPSERYPGGGHHVRLRRFRVSAPMADEPVSSLRPQRGGCRGRLGVLVASVERRWVEPAVSGRARRRLAWRGPSGTSRGRSSMNEGRPSRASRRPSLRHPHRRRTDGSGDF